MAPISNLAINETKQMADATERGDAYTLEF